MALRALIMPEPMTRFEILHRQDEWRKNWVSVCEDMQEWQKRVLGRTLDIILGRVRDGWPTRGETVEEC